MTLQTYRSLFDKVQYPFCKQDHNQEARLYEFLGRVRLNIALDALRLVRCVARTADRDQIAHSLIYEAVHAYHRRSVMGNKLETQVFRTYTPPLDEQVSKLGICLLTLATYTSQDLSKECNYAKKNYIHLVIIHYLY